MTITIKGTYEVKFDLEDLDHLDTKDTDTAIAPSDFAELMSEWRMEGADLLEHNLVDGLKPQSVRLINFNIEIGQ